MLPTDSVRVNPVGRVDAPVAVQPVGDARQQAFERALAGLVGKSLQGEILSKLTDGSFLVKVAGTAARMPLPAGVQVGQQVPLTLVAAGPRPTFQLQLAGEAAPRTLLADAATVAEAAAHADAAGAAGAHAAAPQRPLSWAAAQLSRAPLTPAAQLPQLDARSAPATLSPTARLLAGVLAAAQEAGPAPRALQASAPVAPAPDVAPEQLAGALRATIGKSGLFYESHVAEWAGGARPLSDLAEEPQMQAAGARAPEAAARQAAPAGDAATAQFINLQLLSHEQGRVAWQGEVWPGQQMQWEIHKDAPERRPGGQDGPAAPPDWRSGLRLRFALLGEIDATLVLRGDQLHIALRAGSGEVGELLRRHAGGLDAALEAAGVPAASLAISAAAPDPGPVEG